MQYLEQYGVIKTEERQMQVDVNNRTVLILS